MSTCSYLSRRRARRAVRGFLAFVSVGVVLLAGACAGSSSNLSIVDSFSGSECEWSTDETAQVALRCQGGAYHMLLKRPSYQLSRLTFAPVRSLRVEVDATRIGGVAPGTNEFHGVSCWTAISGYILGLTSDGHYEILQETEMLAQGPLDRIPPRGSTTRIGAHCQGGDEAKLTLSVDGVTVATATDDTGLSDFTAVGLYATSQIAGTKVVFDNAEITGQE